MSVLTGRRGSATIPWSVSLKRLLFLLSLCFKSIDAVAQKSSQASSGAEVDLALAAKNVTHNIQAAADLSIPPFSAIVCAVPQQTQIAIHPL